MGHSGCKPSSLNTSVRPTTLRGDAPEGRRPLMSRVGRATKPGLATLKPRSASAAAMATVAESAATNKAITPRRRAWVKSNDSVRHFGRTQTFVHIIIVRPISGHCRVTTGDPIGRLHRTTYFSGSASDRSNIIQLLASWAIRNDTKNSLFLDFSRTNQTRYSRWWRQTSPPVTLAGELDETYESYLILAYSLHYTKTLRHPQDRKYIMYCIAVRRGPSHDVTRIEHLVKLGRLIFKICERTDRQINRQTRCS